ncbi:MAG: helix-turn-helix domain-containing protein [Planctomycetota bacterium]
MVSKAIEQELEVYRIGEKVRLLRKDRNLLLSEVEMHTGLSKAMLSKIESGKIVPTLPTLTRIALAFSVGLDYFFADDLDRRAFGITREDQRVRMAGKSATHKMPFDFESLDYTVKEADFNTYLAHFKNESESNSHSHAGVEFLYLIVGKLQLIWNSNRHVLSAGDSLYFDSAVEHSYLRLNKGACTAVVITTRG